MKLYYSSASPYARKVVVVAHELGLDKRIELVPASVVPLKPEPTISKANPLAKIPTLLTDEGEPLYDSGVITEYLDSLSTGRKVIPASGPARWRVKRLEALGDGMTDAGILTHNVKVFSTTEFDAEDKPIMIGEGTPTAHPGETVTSKVITLKPGRYRLACSIANHDDLGEHAVLVVEGRS